MRPKNPARRSMSSLRRPGRNSLSCTAPCRSPRASASRASRAISSACSRVVAMGFSQYTCLPARSAWASSCGRICVVPASKKTSLAGSCSAASRWVPQRATPWACASASTLAASRPMSIGSGMTRSPLAKRTPPCALMARMERIRCWWVPIRPVTPCITMPRVRVLIRGSSWRCVGDSGTSQGMPFSSREAAAHGRRAGRDERTACAG